MTENCKNLIFLQEFKSLLHNLSVSQQAVDVFRGILEPTVSVSLLSRRLLGCFKESFCLQDVIFEEFNS